MMSAAFSITARRVLGPVVDHDAKALDADSTASRASSTLAAAPSVTRSPVSGFRRWNVRPPVGVPTQVVNYQLRLHPGLSVTIDLLLAEVMIQACLHDDGMPARFVQTLAHQRADGRNINDAVPIASRAFRPVKWGCGRWGHQAVCKGRCISGRLTLVLKALASTGSDPGGVPGEHVVGQPGHACSAQSPKSRAAREAQAVRVFGAHPEEAARLAEMTKCPGQVPRPSPVRGFAVPDLEAQAPVVVRLAAKARQRSGRAPGRTVTAQSFAAADLRKRNQDGT